MQEKETGSWLARDGDGRVLEVGAGGYPGAEASPDDGRLVAEAEEPAREDLAGRTADQIEAAAGRIAEANELEATARQLEEEARRLEAETDELEAEACQLEAEAD